MQNEQKNKHMTLQDRIEIQEDLSKGIALISKPTRNKKHQATGKTLPDCLMRFFYHGFGLNSSPRHHLRYFSACS